MDIKCCGGPKDGQIITVEEEDERKRQLESLGPPTHDWKIAGTVEHIYVPTGQVVTAKGARYGYVEVFRYHGTQTSDD